MAKIGSYAARTEARTPFNLTAEANVAVPNLGAKIGAGIADAGAALQRRADEEDDLWVARTMAQTRADWIARLRANKEKAPPGAPGFAREQTEAYDTWSVDALDAAPSRRARKALETGLLQFRTSLATESMSFEAEARVAHRVGQIQEVLDKEGATLVSRPELFQQSFATVTQAIESANLPPAKRESALKAARKDLARSAVQGLIESNPSAALARLNKGEFDGYLDGATKAALVNRAQAEQRSRASHGRQMMALERAELRESWADKVKAYAEGEATPYGPGGEDKRMSAAHLARYFGPERAQRMVLALTDAAVAGSYKRELATAPTDAVAALRERYRLPVTEQGARTEIAANKAMDRETLAEMKARLGEARSIVKAEIARSFAEQTRGMDLEAALETAERQSAVRNRITALVGLDASDAIMGRLSAAAKAGEITKDIREGVPKGDALAAIAAAVDGLDDEKLQKALTGIVDRTLAEREKGLRDDPAGYVAANNTAVRGARQRLADTLQAPGATPEDKRSSTEAFAQAVTDAQRQMGVLAPRVLGADLAAQLAAELRKPGDGSKAQIVQGMAETWGKFWPQVAGELAQKGEGAPELAALAMVPPDSPIARDLSALIGVKTSELEKPLDSGARTGLKGYLAGHLKELRNSVQFGIADPAYRGLSDATYRLALKYLNDGDGAAAAAEKATKFIADRYGFETINGAVTRIPKSMGDPKAIGFGIRQWIAGVDNIDLPDDWQRLFPKTAEKEARAAFTASARARAQAVAGEGDSGFYVMMNGRHLTRFGEPLFVDFRSVPHMSGWVPAGRTLIGDEWVERYFDPVTKQTIERRTPAR